MSEIQHSDFVQRKDLGYIALALFVYFCDLLSYYISQLWFLLVYLSSIELCQEPSTWLCSRSFFHVLTRYGCCTTMAGSAIVQVIGPTTGFF